MNDVVSIESKTLVVPTRDELRGMFDWVNDGFKKGEATDWQLDDSCKGVAAADPDVCELIHFDKDMSTDDVLHELKSCGLRPATLDELLAYAWKYPDAQKQFLIVALGVSCYWNAYRRSPCIHWNGEERVLSLCWLECGWDDDVRFLAVRK